jgi:hypothetical protein
MERPSEPSVAGLQPRRELEAKLYQEGLTLEQIAKIVDRNIATIHHDLNVLGVERRKRGPAKGTPRPALRKHPLPTPRPCAYCGEDFTPRHATHVGKFCTPLCHNRANAKAQGHKKGEWRTCLQCGESFWKYASQMLLPTTRGDFCTPTCWGRYRWSPQSGGESVKPLIKANAERGHFGGQARKHYGRRFAARYGALGGQAKKYNEEQAEWIHELRRLDYSYRDIAGTVGLSKTTVARILGPEKGS